MNHFIKNIKYPSFATLTLFVVFIVVNQFDESLDPEIQSLIDKKYQYPEKTKNAYYALAGFYTANEADMVSKGEEIIQAYLKEENPGEFDYKSVKGAADINELESLKGCKEYSKPNRSCLKEYASNKVKYKKQIKDNDVVLKRYKKLLTYNDFMETSTYLSFMMLANQSLYLSDVGVNWLEGNKTKAVAQLFYDIRFHRMVIRESTYLISQMIASASLFRDYSLLVEFIRECPRCVSYNEKSKTILSDLSDNELLFTRVIPREVQNVYLMTKEYNKKYKGSKFEQYLDSYYAPVVDKDKRNSVVGILGYFTLENATLNIILNVYKKNIKLSKYKYADFNTMKEKILSEKNQVEFKWYDYFYNPGGKILSKMWGEFNIFYPSYFEAKFILGSRIRLARLLLNIKEKGIAKKNIQQFLDRQDEANRDPYTGEPIAYDTKNNSIFINNSNKNKTEIYL